MLRFLESLLGKPVGSITEDYVRNNIYSFHLIGGNAVNVYYRRPDLFGDWDTTLLINPNLPTVIFEAIRNQCKQTILFATMAFLGTTHSDVLSEYERLGLPLHPNIDRSLPIRLYGLNNEQTVFQIAGPAGSLVPYESPPRTPFTFAFYEKAQGILPNKSFGYIEISLLQLKTRTQRVIPGKLHPVSEFLVDITIPLPANPMIHYLWDINKVHVTTLDAFDGYRCERFPILDKVSLWAEQRRSSMPNVETRESKVNKRQTRAAFIERNITRSNRNRARIEELRAKNSVRAFL